MRRGIDGLAGTVIEKMELEACDKDAVFIFADAKKIDTKYCIGKMMASCYCTKKLKKADSNDQMN